MCLSLGAIPLKRRCKLLSWRVAAWARSSQVSLGESVRMCVHIPGGVCGHVHFVSMHSSLCVQIAWTYMCVGVSLCE